MSKTAVTTPKFRVSFPNVFNPKENELSGKMEYSVQALFEKGADLSKLKAAMDAACEETFGKDREAWPELSNNPFREQGKKKKDGTIPDNHVKGAFYMNLKSTEKPTVVDRNLDPIVNKADFYAGCWAIASVNAYAYPKKNSKMKGVKPGVSFGLNHIQFVKDDKAFSSKPRVEDVFQPIEEKEDGALNSMLE